ncbi:MAG: hypothetical protein A2268_06285 [Candidatus Raymondbacteria bacterium RifOxyA12_full_50_37]|nr:MAG: hypothetical protein A2268_06285 [Candidatus Raymondbacteria bacterium RifOxyA12_full_50_37]OGJ94576.1 MAG: hypothetical protein A2248_15215 [Candidatus Raymondbacteria bacterium RIFOXYA2_FULL_49_16]OGK00216.1 MAG: hypothetical protein A2350_13345 [Candidatus Raymondbacteria bacterium RifOxyB12_full_50_8]OGK03006.1 MAG: hypothetical protein A2487_14755 [Candidatus Raymondbacteria bacterium RifOxyC12_full_50_8]OGP45525.1 MAG: hypothetical protein A2324_15295 [Candidatus Raymondbacteria b
MVRTQIYLTKTEHQRLKTLACERGKRRSALIREAIDRLIDELPAPDRITLLHNAFGIWSDRTDLASAREIRKQWERQTR